MRKDVHERRTPNPEPRPPNFIAVDFGNTRTKFGLFAETDEAFPLPLSVCTDFSLLESWLLAEPLDWVFARTGGNQDKSLQDWIRTHRFGEFAVDLTFRQIPMELDVDSPEQVGIDRLLAAFAALRWRSLHGSDAPLLVVDVGSAMTVDVVTTDGVFRGGAIFPGFAASADAVVRISPKLPRINVTEMDSPVYPGRNTEDAVAAGIYWGAVGAVRQCYEKSGASAIVLTGGNGNVLKSGLSQSLPPDVLVEIPELVLAGIALCKW